MASSIATTANNYATTFANATSMNSNQSIET